MKLFGSIKTVDEIVAPLKDTLAKLKGASAERETEMEKNETEITRLQETNKQHAAEIEHADRITLKIEELLK